MDPRLREAALTEWMSLSKTPNSFLLRGLPLSTYPGGVIFRRAPICVHCVTHAYVLIGSPLSKTKKVTVVKQDSHIGCCCKILGPKLIFVIGSVKFVTAVARLVCPDLLG